MPNSRKNQTYPIGFSDQTTPSSENFLTIPIFGDSMYPAFRSGDLIFCRLIDHRSSILPFGEAFLIITDEFKTLKYLRRCSKEGYFLAVSENSDRFEPMEIPVNRIQRLYLVTGVMQRTSL